MGFTLSDVGSLQILREIYQLSKRPLKNKLPSEPVDVMNRNFGAIKHHYSVTKKLDGLRQVLFGRLVCSLEEGDSASKANNRILQLFAVGSRLNVEFLCSFESNLTGSFVFDCEMLEIHETKRAKQYFAFAAFVYDGKPCHVDPLAVQVAKIGLVVYNEPQLQNIMQVKQFYTVDSTAQVLRRSYLEYKDDGLIFTRNQVQGWFSMKTHIKYKPLHEITIDFQLREQDLFIDGTKKGELAGTLPSQIKACYEAYAKENKPFIIECSAVYPLPNHNDMIAWFNFVKHRPDKTTSNYAHVFESNMNLLRDNIDIIKMCHGPDFEPNETKERPQASSSGYWKSNSTLNNRIYNLITPMRGFNNHVKDLVYKRIFQNTMESNPDAALHVELGYGRGGDMHRIFKYASKTSIKKIIALDSDAKALQEANKRFETWKSTNTSTTPVDIDLHTVKVNLQLDTQVDALFDDCIFFKYPNNTAHTKVATIGCHFACHYFARNMNFLANQLLVPYGRIGITVFSYHRVNKMLDDYNGHVIFNVNGRKVIEIIRLKDDAIDLYVDSIGKFHKETLCRPNDLFSDNFKLVDRFYFDDVVQSSFFNQSSPLWDFVGLYEGFVFEKLPPDLQQQQPTTPLTCSSSSGVRSRSRSFSRSLSPFTPCRDQTSKSPRCYSPKESASPLNYDHEPRFKSPRCHSPPHAPPSPKYYRSGSFIGSSIDSPQYFDIDHDTISSSSSYS